MNEDDASLLQGLRKLHPTEVNKYVNRNSPFAGIWENIIHNDEDGLPADTESLITEYIYPKLKKIFAEQQDKTMFFYLPAGKAFTTKNLQPVTISPSAMVPALHVDKEKNNYVISCTAMVNELDIDLQDNEWDSDLAILYDNCVYLWDKVEDYEAVHEFLEKKSIVIDQEDWQTYLQKTLLPLTRKYKVEFDKSLVREIRMASRRSNSCCRKKANTSSLHLYSLTKDMK